MPLWSHDTAPSNVQIGDDHVRAIYLDDEQLWNGDVPVNVMARPMRGAGSMPVPTISAGPVIPIDALVGTGTMPAPEVTAGTGISALPLLGTGTMPAPTISAGVTIDAGPMTGSGSMPAPNVGEVQINADPMLGTGTMPVPEVGAGVVIAAAPALGTGTMPAPEISAGVTMAPGPMTGEGAMPAAEFSSGIVISDDFNRTNATTLGADYTAITTSPTLTSNRAQAGSPGFGAQVSYAARHNTPLLTDTQQIVFVPIAAASGSDPSLGGGTFLRCTAGGDLAGVSVTNNAAYITTFIGGTWTTRATSGTIATPTSVRFTADGSLYSVYINGSATAAITWDDSGGLIGIGPSNRYVGVVSNAYNNFSVTRGYAIDSFVARDGIAA